MRASVQRLVALATALAATALIPASIATAQPSGDPGYNGAPMQDSGGPIPTLDGVPCVASNLGVCSSIAQNRSGPSVPRSRVGGSPSIVR